MKQLLSCRSRHRKSMVTWNLPLLTALSQTLLIGTAFILTPSRHCAVGYRHCPSQRGSLFASGSASSPDNASSSTSSIPQDDSPLDSDDKNARYVEGLLDNLTGILDKWIISGSKATQQRAYNILEQIKTEAKDPDLIARGMRMIRRAGLPITDDTSRDSKKELGKTDDQLRREEAEQRKRWEAARSTEDIGSDVAKNVARSALGRREATGKKDIMLGQVDSRLSDVKKAASDKVALQEEMNEPGSTDTDSNADHLQGQPVSPRAAAKVSELVAKAGGGNAFDGETLGIGGLDDVLAQVKRRVWVPLAAPPQLLDELGIHPVRGLLLYGRPGCGKTLLARKLGQLLSPMRPITVVSGPEVLDKFVGSSEKNLREIFDNPPDIFDLFRIGQPDGGDSMQRAALHVVIMDEFDAIARSRGGRGGSGDQGDAGVARDSVVNQLLAKMDGVDPLVVPTLVIGLTNKRSLIEPALLRPGRFEVQVEVPPPRTVGQRVSILKVHTKHMHEAGRLLVRDAPDGTAAARKAAWSDELPSYDELLEQLARDCDGFSGASIAGVCRAAASHALERAVEEFTRDSEGSSLLDECIVTEQDFAEALKDVLESQGDTDWKEDDEKESESEEEEEDDDDDDVDNDNDS